MKLIWQLWLTTTMAVLTGSAVSRAQPSPAAHTHSPANSGAASVTKPLRTIYFEKPGKQQLDPDTFKASRGGWSMQIDLRPGELQAGTIVFTLANGSADAWLKGEIVSGKLGDEARFALRTRYSSEPLTIAIPLAIMRHGGRSDLLLRYRGYSFDLLYDGVLIDQEWPIGEIAVGDAPVLDGGGDVHQVSLWDHPLSDEEIAGIDGGAQAAAANAVRLFGPKPKEIQYSRPLGYNTDAGDTMPFFHNGTFHLYYLLDRRHHQSKWGLGAHQWAHLSSRDLVHWKEYPLALPVDHEWEGSICTGSVFFHDGRYYAFYAVRMPDRNQRLAIAESRDGIHFTKTIPTPFAEPKPPYVRGPNRDPFVFTANGRFHMIVTVAVAKDGGRSQEGALEHLVSNDLKTWAVDMEPFITSGSENEPECSDLFQWGNWYYLLFSLRGTTPYRMSHNPLGPWTRPANDILDGPEAKVMKAAAFTGGRMVLTGFVQYDNRYAGELVFRELVRQADGTLGTKTPPEMQLPETGRHTMAPLQLSEANPESRPVALQGPAHLRATLSLHASAKLTIHVKMASSPEERLVFDPQAATVSWQNAAGHAEPARLEHVTGMSSPMKIDLILEGSIADLEINGHRSMIHRLSAPQVQQFWLEAQNGSATATDVWLSSIQFVPQAGTP